MSSDCERNTYQVTYGTRECENGTTYWKETDAKNDVNDKSHHSKQEKTPF